MRSELDLLDPPTARRGCARLLVLLLQDGEAMRLREEIDARAAAGDHVHVVAPALVRPLDWLATAEDAARHEAELRLIETESALATSPHLAVGGEIGDADPIQAVEDALRSFSADEILVVGGRDGHELAAALERFGLPVSQLDVPDAPPRSPLYRAFRTLAGGRGTATPFVLFAGVNVGFVLLGLLLSIPVLGIAWALGYL